MVLVAVSLTFAVIAIAAFAWAVKNGQFDDMQLPAERIVFDDGIESGGRK